MIENAMCERREIRKTWVPRGQYAIEVEVELAYPSDYPSGACLEPDTVRWLDEVACRAEAGDIEFHRAASRVFRAVVY